MKSILHFLFFNVIYLIRSCFELVCVAQNNLTDPIRKVDLRLIQGTKCTKTLKLLTNTLVYVVYLHIYI